MTQNTPAQTEFFRAIAGGDLHAVGEMVKQDPLLLDSFDYLNFGATPLTAACFGNRTDVAELLIELGADPDKKSDWSMGPWSPLHCATYRRDKALVNFLLARGARMDVHTAAGLGDCEVVSRLLDADPARVVERGGDGCQPLHFADTTAVARLLLDRGAEIDARCVDHFSTPVQYLCTIRPEVACYLLASGAQTDIFSSATCGAESSVEQLLNDQPQLIEARINQAFFPPGSQHDVHNILTFTIGHDATLLHAAARANRPAIVSMLVHRGMPPNVRGGYDQGTPLHAAAWYHSKAAAQMLLDRGADMELRSGDMHNNTPAGWAIVAGADEVFELLMDRGSQCHPWFLDDAREACRGRFNQVSNVSPEQRQRILSRITGNSDH